MSSGARCICRSEPAELSIVTHRWHAVVEAPRDMHECSECLFFGGVVKACGRVRSRFLNPKGIPSQPGRPDSAEGKGVGSESGSLRV